MHFKVRALLIELSSYGCHFTHGDGAWQVQCRIAELQECAPKGAPEARAWEHEDGVILRP